MNTKSLLTLLLLLGTTSGMVVAQKQQNRLGLILHGGLDQHVTAFSRIPEEENCCPEFTGGQGQAFGIGALYMAPISSSFGIDVRVGYYKGSVDLATTEVLTMFNAGLPQTSTIRHDLSVSSSLIATDVLGRFAIGNRLHALAGLTVGYNLSGTYSQAEVLVTPSNATFSSGERVRNKREGQLTSLSGIYGGVTAGLSYEMPINSDNTAFISPEVMFTFSPTNLLQETKWTVNRLRAGLAISFIPPAVEEDLTDIELFDIARSSPFRANTEATSVPVPTVSVSGVNDAGTVSATANIRIEEFASNRVRPLLPYVFFDKGSNSLSPRYRQISKDQVETYSLENFYNLDAMVTYYQMLNVIGKRMQDRPESTIKLVGCRDKSEEGMSDDLAKRRALVIKSYLVDTWEIDAARISIEDRGLPSNASSADDPDGAAENMRVEITSADPSILSPVGSKDTMRVFSPVGIRFAPNVQNAVDLKSWTIFVSQNDQIIKALHGQGVPPSGADWRIAETSRFIPRGTRNIEYMLVVQDSSGKVIPSESQSIAVSEVLLSDKAKTGGTDKNVDRYSLILFGFDRADISPENQSLIDEVKKNITSRSAVRVVGYSDRVGEASYNQTLSERRAKSVAAALGAAKTTTEGVGETLPLYDNQTPEGRFYSRTVEIIVETPR
jgi:outer membrane protein OmpA-like peptidoglycan-associated protein